MKRVSLAAALIFLLALPATAHVRCPNGSHWVDGHYYTKGDQSVWAKGRCVRN